MFNPENPKHVVKELSIPVGATVKHSGYALQSQRDFWQQCGREPQKSRLKEAYLERVALRGVVTQAYHNGYANGYDVLWSNGQTSSCLTCMIELA